MEGIGQDPLSPTLPLVTLQEAPGKQAVHPAEIQKNLQNPQPVKNQLIVIRVSFGNFNITLQQVIHDQKTVKDGP